MRAEETKSDEGSLSKFEAIDYVKLINDEVASKTAQSSEAPSQISEEKKNTVEFKQPSPEFKQTTKNYSSKPLEEKVRFWSSSSINERMRHFLENAFYWSPQGQSFFNEIKSAKNHPIVLTGPKGIGKTAILYETYIKLAANFKDRWFINVRDFENNSLASELKVFTHNHLSDIKSSQRSFVFIDSPYHSKPTKTMLRNDLKAINQLIFDTNGVDVTIVFAIAEDWINAYDRRRIGVGYTGEFRLIPLQPLELVTAYQNIWQSSYPFTDEALLEIAKLCSGIFRRFMELISICLNNTQTINTQSIITKEQVETLLLTDKLLTVLSGEYSPLFKANKRDQALKITEVIINLKTKLNQRQIAEETGFSEASVCRILNTLITNNDRLSVNFKKEIGAHGQAFICLERKSTLPSQAQNSA